MNALTVALAWIALMGAVGGAVNAAFANDTRFWPTRLQVDGHRHITRPGLAIQSVVGAGSAVVILSASGSWTTQAASTVATVPALIAAGIVGAGAARYVTSRADQRLLRAALVKAAGAPAAHPDTTAALAIAPLHEAYRLASDLSPLDLRNSPGTGARADGQAEKVRRRNE